MKNGERRQQRPAVEHGLRRYTKKYRRSRNWTARSVPGRRDCARRVLGGDTKAREHLKEDLADLKEQKADPLKRQPDIRQITWSFVMIVQTVRTPAM